MFVFFQAEDGIRDLVRSRGLGDVYKRQSLTSVWQSIMTTGFTIADLVRDIEIELLQGDVLDRELSASVAVSYTHLTLPTSDLV